MSQCCLCSLCDAGLEMICIPGFNGKKKGIKIREKVFLTNAVWGKWLFNLHDAPVAVQACLNSGATAGNLNCCHLASYTTSDSFYTFVYVHISSYNQ